MNEFHTVMSPIDRASMTPPKKINRETSRINDTIYQMDSIAMYIIPHSVAPEYRFFSKARRTFSKLIF
jgi:hypothetical protein